ncbi:MAG: HEAT repeat protein [Thermoproteota archaeon]|jgi:HEAT repeat protein
MKSLLVLFIIFNLNANLHAAQKIAQVKKKVVTGVKIKGDPRMVALYGQKSKDKKHLAKVKTETLKLGNKAVPTLIKVMKSDKFPEHKRWTATFLLGKIMGRKAAPFIARFASHPNWMLRLASLKTLMAMREVRFLGLYSKALKDKALIIRSQALDIISTLKLTKLAPSVWKMLYDERNYNGGKKRKRGSIVKKVITTLGDLNFDKAKKPLLSMASKKKYIDIFPELDYSLSKLFLKDSPKGSVGVKRHFWKRIGISNIKI